MESQARRQCMYANYKYAIQYLDYSVDNIAMQLQQNTQLMVSKTCRLMNRYKFFKWQHTVE